jgi:hypothetical protein
MDYCTGAEFDDEEGEERPKPEVSDHRGRHRPTSRGRDGGGRLSRSGHVCEAVAHNAYTSGLCAY